MIWLILAAPVAVWALLYIVLSPRRTAWLIGFSVSSNAAEVLREEFGVLEYTLPLSAAAIGFGILQLLASFGRLRLPRSMLPVAMAVIMVAAVVSALAGPFVSAYPQTSAAATTRLLQQVLLGLAILVAARRPPGARALIHGLATGGAVIAVVTVAQLVTGTQGNELLGFGGWEADRVAGIGDTFRAAGSFIDPNRYAQVMVVTAAAALGLGWYRMSPRGWWATALQWAGLVAMMAAVALTASRGGLLALAAVIAVFLVRSRLTLLHWLAVAAAGVALFVGPFGVVARLETLVDAVMVSSQSGTVERSLSGRTSEMLAALDMFEDHPIAGVGYGTYNENYLDYSRNIGLDPRLEQRSAHSLPLEVAAEEGLVGVTVWAGFMVLASVVVWRLRGHAGLGSPITLILLGYSISAVFLHDTNGRLRWTVVALIFHAAVLVGRAETVQPPIRVALLDAGGLGLGRRSTRPAYLRRRMSDLVDLQWLTSRTQWPNPQRLRLTFSDRASSPKLREWRWRFLARLALFRFDPDVVHAIGDTRTFRTAEAHAQEMGGLTVADVRLVDLEAAAAPHRSNALRRLISTSDLVVTDADLGADTARRFAIDADRQVIAPALGSATRHAEELLVDESVYAELLQSQYDAISGRATALMPSQAAVPGDEEVDTSLPEPTPV